MMSGPCCVREAIDEIQSTNFKNFGKVGLTAWLEITTIKGTHVLC
jgi:hypothetical protein